MFYHEQSDDYRPLFWIQGRPIYAHVFLILAHIVAFVTTAIGLSIFGEVFISKLTLFPPRIFYSGEVWRLFSYIIFPPSLWFVFAMGFLYFAGKEVEQFVGRSTFLKLYAALVLLPAILVSLIGLVRPELFLSGTPMGQPILSAHLGGNESIFGVFVAFATIYPGVSINIWFVNLTTKGWAFILLGVYTLIDCAGHAWIALLILWTCAAIGYFGMRFIGAGRGMEWLTDWIEERRARRLAAERNFKIVKEREAVESTDAILDKISKHGVGSLSSGERAVLERARTNLLKRDQR